MTTKAFQQRNDFVPNIIELISMGGIVALLAFVVGSLIICLSWEEAIRQCAA